MTARSSKILKWTGFILLIVLIEFAMFCLMTFVNYKSLFRSGYMEQTEFNSEDVAIIQRSMNILKEEEIKEPISLTIDYSWQSSDRAWLLSSVKKGKEKYFEDYIASEYILREKTEMPEADIWYRDIRYALKMSGRLKIKDYIRIIAYEAENGQTLYFWETGYPEDEMSL